MGEGSLTNQTNKSNQGHLIKVPFDVPMLLIVLVLLVFGLLMVYSASWDFSIFRGQKPTYMFRLQVLWTLIGLIFAAIASFIDYHHYRKFLVPVGLATLGLLVAVLITSESKGEGVTRMLIGGSIQPSELAKAVIIIYLSFWLHNRQDTLNDLQIALIPLGVILGVTSMLILLQPDLSAAVTVGLLGIVLLYFAGCDFKIILIIIMITITAGLPVMFLYPTGHERISAYLTGLNDPLKSSYHIQRSLEAVIKGGWFGVGIGQAGTKFTGLPLAPTDSIFAVIAEETGIFGSAILIILFLLFVWRGLIIAKRAPDQLGSLLAFGLTFWIGLEAMMNMAVMVGLIPFLGNALPLISAGGSSMVVTLTSVGIILNVSKSSKIQQISERSTRSAVVNLRGRNRRGSVPRVHRS